MSAPFAPGVIAGGPTSLRKRLASRMRMASQAARVFVSEYRHQRRHSSRRVAAEIAFAVAFYGAPF